MANEKTDATAPYVYVAQMDIPKEYEDDFNRIYDTDHVPTILKVPGVRACQRYRVESSTENGAPRYVATYEIDSPAVVTGTAWLSAIDVGEWAPRIRPHTTNRRYYVMKRIL